jgi:DNA-directed RNA polymerase subunit RPC12/RpoP
MTEPFDKTNHGAVYDVEKGVKCVSCGTPIAFDQVSGNRWCEPCEQKRIERDKRGPATRLVVCPHCQGRGVYHEYVDSQRQAQAERERLGRRAPVATEPTVEPTAEQREAEHPNIAEQSLLRKRRKGAQHGQA